MTSEVHLGQWSTRQSANQRCSSSLPVVFFSAKSEGQLEELKRLQCKLEQQTQAASRDLDNLKMTLSEMEAKKDRWAPSPGFNTSLPSLQHRDGSNGVCVTL